MHTDRMKYKNLIIIDIDDTFLPHRTAAVGYRLFFSALKKLDLWRLLVLTVLGVMLNIMYFYRIIHNNYSGYMSSKYMINLWADTMIYLNINKKEYELGDKYLKKIYKKTFNIYKKASSPKTYVLGMSQSFVIDKNKDPIIKFLNINEYYSNEFFTKNGVITKKNIILKHGFDKKKIAENIIRKIKPKNTYLFIDDFDDLALLKLNTNVTPVIYSKKIERFIKCGHKLGR